MRHKSATAGGPGLRQWVVPDNYFDEPIAAFYDATEADMFEPGALEPAVAFLAELAGAGPALELGIGTGRIALPLSERGVPVAGIDLSPAMVERLKAKPGGADIPVTIGDFATTTIATTDFGTTDIDAAMSDRFSLVYLVFNTIMNLTTQDEQVECFRNAAAHLEVGGHFVIEVMVPDLQRLAPGETVRPFTVTSTQLGFDQYDVASQGLISRHYVDLDGQFRSFEMPFRYVWPAELDLMARLAGLTPIQRWSNWARAPFTSQSGSHVSVWQKVG